MLPRAPPVTADQPMVKPEEIKPRASHRQVHDAGLRRLGFQTQLGQQDRQLRQRSLGLFPGRAHHHHVIGETDQHPMLANVPCPIDPVQVNVSPNLRRPGWREVPVTCGFVGRGEVCSVDGGAPLGG